MDEVKGSVLAAVLRDFTHEVADDVFGAGGSLLVISRYETTGEWDEPIVTTIRQLDGEPATALDIARLIGHHETVRLSQAAMRQGIVIVRIVPRRTGSEA